MIFHLIPKTRGRIYNGLYCVRIAVLMLNEKSFLFNFMVHIKRSRLCLIQAELQNKYQNDKTELTVFQIVQLNVFFPLNVLLFYYWALTWFNELIPISNTHCMSILAALLSITVPQWHVNVRMSSDRNHLLINYSLCSSWLLLPLQVGHVSSWIQWIRYLLLIAIILVKPEN